MAKYAFPDLLVSTDWVAEHQNDPHVRIVESDEDPLVYQQGHIAGAVRVDWHTDLENAVIRDFIDRERFEQLMSSKGIANDTTVVSFAIPLELMSCSNRSRSMKSRITAFSKSVCQSTRTAPAMCPC